jgi:hypothetical protein
MGIILSAGSFAVEPNNPSSAIIYAHTSSGSHNTTQVTMFIVGIENGLRYLKSEILKPHRGMNMCPSFRRINHMKIKIYYELVWIILLMLHTSTYLLHFGKIAYLLCKVILVALLYNFFSRHYLP